MSVRHLIGVSALLVWFNATWAVADQDDISVIPLRPANHILDQARWLTTDEKEKAQEELTRLYSENNIDIYFVTLAKLPPQGAETYARSLGETWARSPVWCVVFQVPGDAAGFHVEAGGVEMDHGKVDQALQEAIRRARRENTEKERAMAALMESSESLRFIYASRLRHNEKQVEFNRDYWRNQRETKERKKIIIIASVVGGLILLACIVFIFVRVRSKKIVYEFPETSWRTRFQGPHSGGSGILVSYRRKALK